MLEVATTTRWQIPLRAGVRDKGESTLIVYQTKLELLRETRGLH